MLFGGAFDLQPNRSTLISFRRAGLRPYSRCKCSTSCGKLRFLGVTALKLSGISGYTPPTLRRRESCTGPGLGVILRLWPSFFIPVPVRFEEGLVVELTDRLQLTAVTAEVASCGFPQALALSRHASAPVWNRAFHARPRDPPDSHESGDRQESTHGRLRTYQQVLCCNKPPRNPRLHSSLSLLPQMHLPRGHCRVPAMTEFLAAVEGGLLRLSEAAQLACVESLGLRHSGPGFRTPSWRMQGILVLNAIPSIYAPTLATLRNSKPLKVPNLLSLTRRGGGEKGGGGSSGILEKGGASRPRSSGLEDLWNFKTCKA